MKPLKFGALLLCFLLGLQLHPSFAQSESQNEGTRRVASRVIPDYPQLARSMKGQEPHPHCAEQTTLPGQDSAAESEPESMANLTSSQPRFGGPDTGNYLAKHLLLPALFSSMLQLQIRPAQTTPYSFAWYPARACFGGELQSFWHERFFGFGIVTGHPCIGKSHALPVAKGVKQHPLFPAHPEIKQASHRFFIAS
jgi:hypothetical protein